MTTLTREQVRMLAHRAVRMTADDFKIEGFAIPQNVDDAITNKYEFIYYLVRFAQEDEREACAKLCEDYTDNGGGTFADDESHGYELAQRIRARKEKK